MHHGNGESMMRRITTLPPSLNGIDSIPTPGGYRNPLSCPHLFPPEYISECQREVVRSSVHGLMKKEEDAIRIG